MDVYYTPIQAALSEQRIDHALELIEAAIEIIPTDAELLWWRGHAMRAAGQLDAAILQEVVIAAERIFEARGQRPAPVPY